jgi:hypothetical protein
MKLTNISIPNLVYDWVKAKPPKVIDHISPSMLGGCMRAHYFALKHVPQTTPPNPGALLNFQVGFLWEKVIEEALTGLEHRFQWELEIPELNLKGTLDFAINDGKEWEVMDSKTESVMSEMYRKRAKQTYIEASQRYVIQLGCYMMMLRRKGYKCERGRLISITKDNGMIHEHFVPYTEELEATVMNRINTMNNHLKNNTVPECECGDSNWGVGYCNWGDVNTQITNTKGKQINSVCCQLSLLKGEIK